MEKEQKKLRSAKLLFHAIIHFGLMWLFLWDLDYLPMVLIITTLHILMDIIKLYVQRARTKRRWFFIDQAVHLLVLFVAAYWVTFPDASFLIDQIIHAESFWLITTAVIFLTFPSAIIIKMTISNWSAALMEEQTTQNEQKGSLASAGKIIGILERLFVYVLVLVGQWHAVGFLLAAKSVFRFGDLREMRDRKLTEYVLIGTLMSFGVALLTGLVTVYFLG